MSTDKFLVSACLVGEPCRYDGKTKVIPELLELVKEGKAIPFCPEEEGGLPTPRLPAERRQDKVIRNDGEDVTQAFMLGAQKALELCQNEGIKRAILKSKSPSCGNTEIYDGSFSQTLTPGQGLTTELLRKNGIDVINEKEYLGE